MTERVTISIKDGIADVRMNRADKMNAIDPAMFAGLNEAGRKLKNDKSVRVVVLSGEGRAFCSGLDFSSFKAMAGEGERETGSSVFGERDPDSPANVAQSAAYIWFELPMPVIAAVHGVAFGGGLQIALGADIRYVTPDCRMSVLEIKWGLVPDMSGTQIMRHLLPLDVIKELTYTGREVSGAEAVQMGLATHVSDNPYDSAMELAKLIASKSPHAIRADKKLLNAAGVVSVAEGLKLEETLQRELIGTPNQVESVMSNMEKRAANYTDPE